METAINIGYSCKLFSLEAYYYRTQLKISQGSNFKSRSNTMWHCDFGDILLEIEIKELVGGVI